MKVIDSYFKILYPPPERWQELLILIETAGRTCYKSESKITPKSAGPFVRKLIERGHESVIEHASATVRIVCDRGVSHEIVRHRLASYSQESTRYCCYKDQITVIEPCFWDYSKNSPDQARIDRWETACKGAEVCYTSLIRQGATPQQARSVLPNSLKTEIVMTANLREWRHFFRLRTSPAAHPQMRQIAIPMLRVFKRLLPDVFFDIEIIEDLGGKIEHIV